MFYPLFTSVYKIRRYIPVLGCAYFLRLMCADKMCFALLYQYWLTGHKKAVTAISRVKRIDKQEEERDRR